MEVEVEAPEESSSTDSLVRSSSDLDAFERLLKILLTGGSSGSASKAYTLLSLLAEKALALGVGSFRSFIRCRNERRFTDVFFSTLKTSSLDDEDWDSSRPVDGVDATLKPQHSKYFCRQHTDLSRILAGFRYSGGQW